ncbi:OmpH family outer membrane protein [Desulfomonile tiedjei]|uniref:Outer membrane protein n=1 Tax=Desulfomonile tiedjei (strain ATCC 49306 / DSM 6799 / DCB-1) TaxID=706587 RepID=I4C888_DESTA|nr:OmpH family outer membrane protein [Desulfomonile tiedjei]AFM25779.1 outer membrane protein [Desulfomonile tiedjei DSM 6799]
MKKLYIATICAVLATAIVTSGVCWAEERFAFVNLQLISRKSVKAQQLQKKVQQLAETKKAALEKKRAEMMSLQEQIQKQSAMLKNDAREKMMKDLGIKEVEYKLAEQEAQNSLQNEQREVEEVFIRDISKVVAKLRTDKKLTAIFNSMMMLSFDDSLDLTDEVIKLYDAAPDTTARPAPPAPPKPKAGPK